MSSKITLPPGPGRLPPTAIPRHYDLHYESIDLERHTFAGTVSIDVDIPASSSGASGADDNNDNNVIILHAIELDILSATFQPSGDDGAVASQAYEFRYHIPSQSCSLLFAPSSIAPSSSGKLVLRFRGILNDLMHGLYRSTHTALDGRELTIATTQFEPTGKSVRMHPSVILRNK